jgi:hypothetical protein
VTLRLLAAKFATLLVVPLLVGVSLSFARPGRVEAIAFPVNEPGAANAPYAVALLVNLDAGVFDPQLFCSGALIAPDLVLTAAHCAVDFDSANLHIGTGSENIHEVSLHPVVGMLVHPGYVPAETSGFNPLANDIALLRLGVPVTDVAAIRLAPAKDAPVRGARSNLRTLGWGVGAGGTHRGWLGRSPQRDITFIAQSPYADLDTDTQLLARGRRGSVPCVGDSGGPLVGNRPGKTVPFLVGLVSYGSETCDPRMPVVYTRVAGQRSWIEEATRALRSRTATNKLTYRSNDRSRKGPEGTRVLTGELGAGQDQLTVVLSDADLGAHEEPDLIVRVADGPDSGDAHVPVRRHAGPCRTGYGREHVDGTRRWWMNLDPSCLGLRGRATDVISEIVRDGLVLDEIHFTRVRIP